jgi:hypothetical protein
MAGFQFSVIVEWVLIILTQIGFGIMDDRIYVNILRSENLSDFICRAFIFDAKCMHRLILIFSFSEEWNF